MNCKLSGGLISSFRLNDVLYVPKLSLPLLSWQKIRSKGYQLIDNGKVTIIQKDNKIWLEAKFDDPLPVISEAIQMKEFACSTYEFWHQVLCHSAPLQL